VKNTHSSKNVPAFLNSPNIPICLQKKVKVKDRKKNAGEKKLFVQLQVLDGLFNVHTCIIENYHFSAKVPFLEWAGRNITLDCLLAWFCCSDWHQKCA